MKNKGIQYPAAGQMAFIDLGAPPVPADQQIIIRSCHTGITNGTERHALVGELLWQGLFPSSHGYQQVGRIESVGPQVVGFKPGDLVFNGDYVGHRDWTIVDLARSPLVFPLPANRPAHEFALLGVAGVAMRGVRRCRVGPAQKVWVSGQGLIGQFAAQSARALGAEVTVSDIDEHRLELSRRTGAHRALNVRTAGWEAELKQRGPFDVILDCSGHAGFFPHVARDRLLVARGAIGLLAVRADTTFPWTMLHAGVEGSIEVSCHFSVDDLRVLAHFIQHGLIQVAPLISHHVPVTQAPALYAILRDRPSELLGVVFDWQ